MAKTSISIDPDDLKWLRARARTHHGGNLSAAVSEATRRMRHNQRMRDLMTYLGAPELTAAEKAAIDRELDGPRPPRAKRGKRAA